MPFIISAGTFVTGFGVGIQSINLAIAPQIQRLYQLGTAVPFDRNQIIQKTLTISRYGGGGNSAYDVSASLTCDEPTPLNISIAATNCSGDNLDEDDEWFVNSYSYSKDVQGWGVESWSLVTRPEVLGGGDAIARMIRGVAEGQSTINGGANTGVTFLAGTINGQTAEVTAGSPGIGKAFNISYGEISSVGGATTGKSDGLEGNAQVSIPYIPIYLPS